MKGPQNKGKQGGGKSNQSQNPVIPNFKVHGGGQGAIVMQQHPSNTRKLTESIGPNSNLVKAISSGQKFNNTQGLNHEAVKKAGFEFSRNQMGSRGRSHGNNGQGSQPRRNI